MSAFLGVVWFFLSAVLDQALADLRSAWHDIASVWTGEVLP